MPEQTELQETVTTEGTDTTTSANTETATAPTDAKVDLSFEAPHPTTETTPEPTEGTTPDADEGASTDTATAEQAEAKTEPEVQEAEPLEAFAEPEFDDTLLREARQRGFSDEQAKAFGQADRLRDAMTAMDRRLMGAMNAPQPLVPQPQAPVAQATPPPQPVPGGPLEAPPSEFKVHLDPENFDAEIIDQFNKMNTYYQQHVTNMQRAIGQFMQQTNVREHTAKVERFDAYMNSLGSEYESLVGKGTVDELDPRSPAVQKRDEIWRQRDALEAAYEQHGQSMPSPRALLARATRAVLSDDLASLERKKLNGKVEERRKQVVHRPTQRKSKAGTPLEGAVEAVKAIVRDRGINMNR